MDLLKLAEPFEAFDIEWRVGPTTKDKSKGIALGYVTNRAIMNRLDEICGPAGWRNEFKEWKGKSQLCGLSIKVDDEWITKWDGADDSDMEATKGGLSDAMKRAGYQWGIGRYLYYLDAGWYPLKPQGRSYVLAEIPELPPWALPGGSGRPKQGAPVLTPTPGYNKPNKTNQEDWVSTGEAIPQEYLDIDKQERRNHRGILAKAVGVEDVTAVKGGLVDGNGVIMVKRTVWAKKNNVNDAQNDLPF